MKKLLAVLFLFFVLPFSVSAETVLLDTLTGSANSAGRVLGNDEYQNWVGGYFSSSTTITLGRIDLLLSSASTTYDNTAVLYIFNGTTTDRASWSLVGTAVNQITNEPYQQETVGFDFNDGLTLWANQEYVLEVRPLTINYDNADFYVWGHTGDSRKPWLYTYNNLDNEFWYPVPSRPLNVRFIEYEFTQADSAIYIDTPCETNSLASQPCMYGYASGTALTVHGITKPIQSWYTTTYDVLAILMTADGTRITADTVTIPDNMNEYDFTLALIWDTPQQALADLYVCQVPSDGTVAITEGLCAKAVIGFDMSTASTSDMYEFWNAPRTYEEDIALFQECDSIGIFDVKLGVKCALIWAFFPDTTALNKFVGIRNDILTVKPIGYGTFIIADYINAVQSTSTSAMDREINFGRWFGLSDKPTTTIAFAPLVSSDLLTVAIFDWIDFMLWFVFFMWIIWYAVTRKL